MEFPDEVARMLEAYVYLYIDPRNHQIFYIGKGRGNRAFQHLADTSDKEKVAKIREIVSSGRTPAIEFLRYGLTDSQAEMIEAIAIDLMAQSGLTNEMRGRDSVEFGRISAAELIAIHSAPPVRITDKIMLININKTFRYGMSPDDLYHATRGVWPVGTDRDKAKYALAVFRGVVREAYRIDEWQPAATTLQRHRPEVADPKYKRRWEFVGAIADENTRRTYCGKNVRAYLKEHAQFPITYVNIKKA